MTPKELEESGALQELAARLSTYEDALSVLANLSVDEASLDLARLPPFDEARGPLAYFRAVVEELDRDPQHRALTRLLTEAARILPGSGPLAPFRTEAAPMPRAPLPEERAERTLVLELESAPNRSDVREPLERFRALWKAASARGKEIRVDVVSPGSVLFHASIRDATEDEASAFVHAFQRTLPAHARVYREGHAFRDYFMDPLFAEGPDSQRFELDHIRASTRVGEIARSVMSQYDDVFWPTDKRGKRTAPTVDLRGPGGEVRRVPSDRTLHDAGVRPHETLSIFPERRAGSVNPFLRAESLTVVRNQILDFAKGHPGFEVAANSTDIPTEYLFRFRAPAYAPGSPPRLVDRHEVLLVMPPDFPVKAPQAFWQHDVFHPNVHMTTGLVCLGVLAESYKPGLHFGTVCQMLVDIASYKNYALDEGYNPEAARWALSDEGQVAILAIGGRSREEVLGMDDAAPGSGERPRRIHLRRVGT